MSDIFQEVDEEVRRDKAAEFWKKYQNQILAAAVLIVLASAGFRYWQYERERATQAAGDQFQQALTALEGGKLDEAKAGLDKIAAQAPSGYRALAQMTAAGAEASKDPQGAIGAFDAISGDAAIDPLLRDTARLRAALLRVDIPGEQQKGEAALTALSGAGGPYRRLAALALGALALDRKDDDDASKQFDLVLGDPAVSPGEREAASRWLGLIASNRSARRSSFHSRLPLNGSHESVLSVPFRRDRASQELPTLPMSSFPIRPLEIWRSSIAGEIKPIRGVFEYEVLDTLMVMQTLDFLREWQRDQPQPPGKMNGFVDAMSYYRPPQSRLWYRWDFDDADALFKVETSALYTLIRDLEIIVDINVTVSTINYLADVGVGPSQPLLIIRRRPVARGIGFEVEERGHVRNSFLSGDLILSDKIGLAQQHYSTGITLLAAEDQLPGLLDGAFMQFYLATEAMLEEHEQKEAVKNGKRLFSAAFDANLGAIVEHVYVARNRFFGHAHAKWSRGLYDPAIAFQIAKQILVARWSARKLIALALHRDLVHRELRLYQGAGGSIEFTGNAALLQTEFKLPS